MQYLKTGDFFGITRNVFENDSIFISESVYVSEIIDWHYHANAYFSFIISGNLIDKNKSSEYSCSPGTLLFHNTQDPHINIMKSRRIRSLHVEFKKENTITDLGASYFHGDLNIMNPDIKLSFYKVYKELKINDVFSGIEIENQIWLVIDQMAGKERIDKGKPPAWVNRVKEILHNKYSEKITLTYLSDQVQIHPVHLSRYFPKYFNCTIGNYIRKIKIEKSLSMLLSTPASLTDIAIECDFSDQSHYIRCFRQLIGLTPSKYRSIIKNSLPSC